MAIDFPAQYVSARSTSSDRVFGPRRRRFMEAQTALGRSVSTPTGPHHERIHITGATRATSCRPTSANSAPCRTAVLAGTDESTAHIP